MENSTFAYFKDCIVKGERYDAVGLFKSENKDTFLKVSTKNENFELETLQGINLNKVDKGCLIYNTNKEQGYLMSIIDGTSRAETSYWMDDFLQVRQRQDEYFETQETLDIYIKNTSQNSFHRNLKSPKQTKQIS